MPLNVQYEGKEMNEIMPFKTKIKIKYSTFFIPLLLSGFHPFLFWVNGIEFLLWLYHVTYLVSLDSLSESISTYYSPLFVLLSFQFSPLSFFLAICYYPFAFERSSFLAFYAYCFAHVKIIFYPK